MLHTQLIIHLYDSKQNLLLYISSTIVSAIPKDLNSSRIPLRLYFISILCFLLKVLEKIALDQIREFLKKEKILDPLQTGFKKHHSTETALLKLTEDIRRGIDKKCVTLLLLFDFSKAFDTISPSRLLERLRLMGFYI